LDLEDELNLENLQRAQEKYIDLTFIPKGVKTVLDVGWNGGNALRLKKRRLQLKLISRSSLFKLKLRGSFHLTKFETFETSKKYDLVLMERVQYIQIREGFENAVTLLNDEGALLVSDYFLRENVARDNMSGGRNNKKINYLEIAKEYGFEVVKAEDITVVPTLDLARLK